MRTNFDDLITKAEAIKCESIKNTLIRLRDAGVSFPADEMECFRFRGIGNKTRDKLKQIGAVKRTFTELTGLSVRSANVLENLGLKNRDEVIEAIKSGRLSPIPKVSGTAGTKSHPRNYGWKSHAEVCQWAGFAKPIRKKASELCPHCGKDILLKS